MWLVPDNGCVEKISQCNEDGTNLHVVKPGGTATFSFSCKDEDGGAAGRCAELYKMTPGLLVEASRN